MAFEDWTGHRSSNPWPRYGYRRCVAALCVASVAGCWVACGKQAATRDAEPSRSQSASLNIRPVLKDFAVLAENSIRLQTGSTVQGGDIGARGRGAGPFLSGGVALDVAGGIHITAPTDLIADSIRLGAGASVADVQTNRLVGTGTRSGALSVFVPLPALPALARSEPGASNLSVASGSTLLASPRAYAAISVQSGGRLRLAQGTYDAASLSLASGGRIEALGSVLLRIAARVSVATGAFVGAASGAAPATGQVRIEVAGRNGTTDRLDALPSAMSVGSGSRVNALLLVPNGTLTLASGAMVTGAALARDVEVGSGAGIVFQHGFADAAPCPGSCDDGNSCTWDACETGSCTNRPHAAGVPCADADRCNGAEACDGAGRCAPGAPIVCAPQDECHLAGSCEPATGSCNDRPRSDGSACDDGNPCTLNDRCGGGLCLPGQPLACLALDECHGPGVCDPAGGRCSSPPLENVADCGAGIVLEVQGPSLGLAPFAVRLVMEPALATGIQRIDWDLDGNGSIDASGTNLRAAEQVFAAGDHRPTVEVLDSEGKRWRAFAVVSAIDPRELVERASLQWNRFVREIARNDLVAALEAVDARRRVVFEAALANVSGGPAALAPMFGGTLSLERLLGPWAVFTLAAGGTGEARSLRFHLDAGVWRIHDL